MQAAVLTWQLVILLASGAAAWIWPNLLPVHAGATIGLAATTVHHARSSEDQTQRPSGYRAAAALLAIALLGIWARTNALALAHVAAALILVTAFVVMHVRATKWSAASLLDAVAWSAAGWLVIHVLRI